MKPYFKKLLFLHLVIITLSVLPRLAAAQGPGDPGNGGDIDLPIDGGVSILIAAGVGYGIKKLRDERKKKLDQVQ